jgi:hypothetical protein
MCQLSTSNERQTEPELFVLKLSANAYLPSQPVSFRVVASLDRKPKLRKTFRTSDQLSVGLSWSIGLFRCSTE